MNEAIWDAGMSALGDTVKHYLEAHVTIEPVFYERLALASQIAGRHGFKMAKLLMQKEREATPERSNKDTFSLLA